MFYIQHWIRGPTLQSASERLQVLVHTEDLTHPQMDTDETIVLFCEGIPQTEGFEYQECR